MERLWQAARFIPETARLLGTRYRTLFLFYAEERSSEGETRFVADAMSFLDYLARQNRLALMPQERRALHRDHNRLKRRYRLKRRGTNITAVEKWKILQWLGL